MLLEATISFIEYALLESGTTLAVKLLSKIPVSRVYSGARLNKIVNEVGLLGERGKTTNIRGLKVSRDNIPTYFINDIGKWDMFGKLETWIRMIGDYQVYFCESLRVKRSLFTCLRDAEIHTRKLKKVNEKNIV